MTPTPDTAIPAEEPFKPFTRPFRLDKATLERGERWRVVDAHYYVVSHWLSEQQAQWLCDRLNALPIPAAADERFADWWKREGATKDHGVSFLDKASCRIGFEAALSTRPPTVGVDAKKPAKGVGDDPFSLFALTPDAVTDSEIRAISSALMPYLLDNPETTVGGRRALLVAKLLARIEADKHTGSALTEEERTAIDSTRFFVNAKAISFANNEVAALLAIIDRLTGTPS